MHKTTIWNTLILFVCTCFTYPIAAQDLKKQVEQLANEIEPQVIEWRHEIHQNPELSNREFKTAEKVANHLRSLGIEVQTEVAHTGVVGILKGGQPGPVVALRADMDALPVKEIVDIPFASKVTTMYNDAEVGVMHACGHDTHVAILMGVAEILSEIKDQLRGTVKFIFQPAEEGAPDGERGGAELMVAEGVMKNPDVDVVFGLHIQSKIEVGKIAYRPAGTMASADRFKISVKGAQVHGGYPWDGNDPVVTSAQIIMGLQTIVSRKANLLKAPAVVTVAMVHGGVRNNIIPEEVKLEGTIRSLDPEQQPMIHDEIRRVATNIAESAGATAEVEIITGYPVTYNDPDLTAQMAPTLEEAAGKGNAFVRLPITGAEDFSFFAQEAPGLFFFLGGMPAGMNQSKAPAHHTPEFYVDDSGMKLGIRALCNLTIDYIDMHQEAGK